MIRRILAKKRRACLAILFFSLIFLNRTSWPAEKGNFKSRFSIKFSGGLGSITGGDINRHLRAYDSYLSEMTYYEGGETKIVHYGSDLEAEIRWDISSKFALSAGIGYIYGDKESYFEFRGPFPFHGSSNYPQRYIIFPKIKAIPLKLGFYYTMPLRSRINFFFDAGISYYFSKASLYKDHLCSTGLLLPTYTKEEKYDLNANNFGFHGGIGLEYNIANNLALLLEVQGRYARLNLKGNKMSSLMEAPWVEEEGNLYIGEIDLLDEGYGEYCPDLVISQSMPSGNVNVRRAILDLSGFSLRVGIRIKLF
jgi:opacity protein-like surface antigen